MRRKYLATLAVVTALITSVVPVYADYSKAGDTGSQEISSSLMYLLMISRVDCIYTQRYTSVL